MENIYSCKFYPQPAKAFGLGVNQKWNTTLLNFTT